MKKISYQKEVNNMKVLEAKFVQDFINMCNEGYLKGWHERNGGNLTYRIKPEEISTKEMVAILLIALNQKK